MKIFLFCKPYLLSQKYTIVAYIALTLLSSAIGIIFPYVIGNFLDDLVISADKSVIFRFCIIFGGLSILKILKDYITSIMYTKMQVQMGYDLNIRVIKHVQSLSLSFINQKDGMYLNQRFNGDSYNLITFCLTTLKGVITNIILIVVPFVILLANNWLITVLMIGFILVYIILYLALREWLYKAGLVFKESQAKFISKLYEQLKHIKLIKINSIQSELNKRAEDSFADFKATAIHSQKVNFVYLSLDGMIASIAQITLFVIGGLQILKGNFTVGMFTIFSSYFSMMLGASRYFFGLGATYQNAMGSYNRIKDILKCRGESYGEKVVESIDRIELLDISFNYNTFPNNNHSCEASSSNQEQETIVEDREFDTAQVRVENVIDSFSAKFSKGNMYAVTGPNGAGKSTIISLIMGLYIHEYDGEIKYDDVCIREIDMVTTRKRLIGFAEQEPLLINDSIRYNLDYNDNANINGIDLLKNNDNMCADSRTVSLDECIKILNMESFIDQNSFSFIINEMNTNISGGEKQKISILKVLYKNPEVMIFDEPTSALDMNTTRKFINYLQKIKTDKIIIIVTHDEYVKGCCDEIVQI